MITLDLLVVNVATSFSVEVEDWVAQQVPLRAVQRREDIEGKWLIYKVH